MRSRRAPAAAARVLAAAALLLVLLRGPRPAAAHQTSVKYLDLEVAGREVAVTFRVAPGDVAELMGLPADAAPAPAAAAAHPAVAPAVAGWLALAADGAPCPAGPAAARLDEDGRYLAIAWRATCAAPVARLTLDLDGFFAVDPRHAAIVRVASPGAAPLDTIAHAADTPLTLRLGEPPPGSLGAWVRTGMDHIYEGRDHVCFVLALLLVLVLARGPDGGWALRRPVAALRATAGIVTAFTVAHSLTLIAASLGWISLPGRFVEAAIAASIAYTAVEDVVAPAVRWRAALTFAFGLVHGLGFASVLAELLPPRDVVVPLLCFNVGVELGQLTVVAVALPALLALARLVGAARYRRFVLPALAAAIFLLGAAWLVERVAGVTLLGV